MGYKFRLRKSFKTPFGRINVSRSGVSHSVSTPLGSFNKRLIGGSSKATGDTEAASGCFATLASGCLIVVLGFVGIGFVGRMLSTTRPNRVSQIQPSAVPIEPAKTPVAQPVVEQPPSVEVPVLPEVAIEEVEPPTAPEPPATMPVVPDEEVSAPPTTEPAKQKFEPRTWSAKVGGFKVVATLIEHDETNVQLERADNGKLISVAVTALSEADQQYLKEVTVPTPEQKPAQTLEPTNAGAAVYKGEVNKVLDGDTVKFMPVGGKQITLRLEGVDAPESEQRFGPEAKAWLEKQLDKANVRVEITSNDRYGRSLGHVYIGERWLNQELVLAGFAWHYVKYNHDVRLAEAQNLARGKSLGLWADARKVAPWDYRNGQRVETALPANVPSIRENDLTVYVTDTGSKYHRAGCRHLDASKAAIPLSRAKSAYKPCKVCHPPD